MRTILFFLVLSVTLSSCVSYQKYEDALAERDRFKSEFENESNELNQSVQLNRELQDELDEKRAKLQEVQKDLNLALERYDRLDKTNRDLLDRYDRMLKQNETMLINTTEEKRELLAELTSKQIELDRRENALRSLEQEIEKREKEVGILQAGFNDREQRVKELESAIAEKEEKLNTLKGKINEALLGFSDTDLSIREENGKVYVSLSQNLLFSSGSKYINTAGKEAITKLALVLKSNPEIAITVEGHTDTDGEASFNWDLSVGRATSVVKELTKNGVDPKRITAAGRGEFYPIASNNSSAGKAQNRRTEIILSPKLDALYNIINNQ
jgi:chemotaxis protein MotB